MTNLAKVKKAALQWDAGSEKQAAKIILLSALDNVEGEDTLFSNRELTKWSGYSPVTVRKLMVTIRDAGFFALANFAGKNELEYYRLWCKELGQPPIAERRKPKQPDGKTPLTEDQKQFYVNKLRNLTLIAIDAERDRLIAMDKANTADPCHYAKTDLIQKELKRRKKEREKFGTAKGPKKSVLAVRMFEAMGGGGFL